MSIHTVIVVTPPDDGNIDGVKTFYDILLNGLLQSRLFSLIAVTPSASSISMSETSISEGCNSIRRFTCPLPAPNPGIGIYLKSIYNDNQKTTVLLNHWPSMFNVRSIHAEMPNARVIQIVHDLPWLTVFDGNPERFLLAYSRGFRGFQEAEKKFLKYSTYDTVKTFQETDHIVCLCKDTYDFLKEHYDVQTDKLSLIPNGIDDSYILRHTPMQPSNNSQGKHLTVLFTGRPTISKGWDRVIRLAEFFQQKDIQAHILCAGIDCIEKHIPVSGLKSFFVDLGILSHCRLLQLYSEVDFVFIPTRHEQCSYVMLEAMMNGAEIVAYNSYGIRNVLTPECAHIIKNVKEFPVYHEDKGQEARQLFLNRFTLSHLVEKYINLLTK